MSFKPYDAEDNEIGELFVCGDNRYEIVGYENEPCVVIKDIATGTQHTVTIGSERSEEFTKLDYVEAAYWRGYADGERGEPFPGDNADENIADEDIADDYAPVFTSKVLREDGEKTDEDPPS